MLCLPCCRENLKASLCFALSEEKGKLPRDWVQLCFQMCQGSEVKDKSTRMWRTPTGSRFAVCAFLTGGGRWAESPVFLLSTALSERPHFAVVNYDTAIFPLATLTMFTNGTEASKMSAMLNTVGEETSGEVVFGPRWSRGLRLVSDLLHRESLEVLKYSTLLRAERIKSFSATSLIRNFKNKLKCSLSQARQRSVFDW